MKLNLTIKGNPQANARHRTVTRGGKTWTYNPKSKEQKAVRQFMKEALGNVNLIRKRPVRIDLIAYFKIPASRTEIKENDWHIKKPDRDNIDKFYLDCLTNLLLEDDCLICDGRIQKKYSEDPRVEIEITLI